MFCSNCGRELPDEVFFCPNCGKRIERRPNNEKTNSTNYLKNVDDIDSKKIENRNNGFYPGFYAAGDIDSSNKNHGTAASANSAQSWPKPNRDFTEQKREEVKSQKPVNQNNMAWNTNQNVNPRNYNEPNKPNKPNKPSKPIRPNYWGNTVAYNHNPNTYKQPNNVRPNVNKMNNGSTVGYGDRYNSYSDEEQVTFTPLSPGEERVFTVSNFHKYFVTVSLCIVVAAFIVCAIFFVVSLQSVSYKYYGISNDVFLFGFIMAFTAVGAVLTLMNLLSYNKQVLYINENGIRGVAGKYMYLVNKSFDTSYNYINYVEKKFSGVVAKNNRIIIRIHGESYDLTIENALEAKMLIEDQMTKIGNIPC